jgi:hypothetical protein
MIANATHLVAFRRLDLDDVRPLVGKHGRRDRARHHGREVHHADSG